MPSTHVQLPVWGLNLNSLRRAVPSCPPCPSHSLQMLPGNPGHPARGSPSSSVYRADLLPQCPLSPRQCPIGPTGYLLTKENPNCPRGRHPGGLRHTAQHQVQPLPCPFLSLQDCFQPLQSHLHLSQNPEHNPQSGNPGLWKWQPCPTGDSVPALFLRCSPLVRLLCFKCLAVWPPPPPNRRQTHKSGVFLLFLTVCPWCLEHLTGAQELAAG